MNDLKKISANEIEVIDCFLCCENININLSFKCIQCDFTNCIECHKKYLLNSSNEPHCMNCRTIIPYDDFLHKFNDKKWVFTKYKDHKEKNLLEKEQIKFQDTIALIAKNKLIKELESNIQKERTIYTESIKPLNDKIKAIQEELGVIFKEFRNNVKPIESEMILLRNKKKNEKYQYTFKCPDSNCMGFLNSKFNCDLCDVSVCRKCYIKYENKDTHECKQDDIDTFELIKKQAKPCPTCGEFISKISGCDQMFCTSCGSGFSWKTGIVEKGIIHNPHAHTYFQNNEQARNMYINNVNNNNGENCRTPIPMRLLLDKKFLDANVRDIIFSRWRIISEFRQYYRNNYLQKIENNIDINNDIRTNLINKTININHFKSRLHARDKKNLYLKQICNLIISTFNIAELFLWEIAILPKINNTIGNNSGSDIDKQIAQNKIINEKSIKIANNMTYLIEDTNKNLKEISTSFNYSSNYTLRNNFSGFPRKVDQL